MLPSRKKVKTTPGSMSDDGWPVDKIDLAVLTILEINGWLMIRCVQCVIRCTISFTTKESSLQEGSSAGLDKAGHIGVKL